MMADVVVQNPQKSNVYECWRLERNNVWICEVSITSSSGGHRLGGSDPVCCCMTRGRPPVDVLL